MTKSLPGYCGALLEVNLTTGKIEKKPLNEADVIAFGGGRGLGAKMLWDRLAPGADALGPDTPLMFLTGAYSGFPVPCASRTCVVTKSPTTSALKSKHANASTLAYSNVGGFFAPELKFAGYDGIVITGKASSPVYLAVNGDKAELRDAQKFWGKGTDELDKLLPKELGDHRFQSLYIGPAGEKQVRYACIMHTASRAAGRSGTGCVMGSKMLKAVCVRGKGAPVASNREAFMAAYEQSMKAMMTNPDFPGRARYGTAAGITANSERGAESVRNYREGTMEGIEAIGGVASEKEYWVRNYSCFGCPIHCKKSGMVKSGPFKGVSHDGPEYESGALLGANLLIKDLPGLLKTIYESDDYGVDFISAGNVIGFLMEAKEKGHIDSTFLDGIDLKWGDVESTRQMLRKITYREGVGDLASRGVKALAKAIGKDSDFYAIHVKGQECAGHNVHVNPPMGMSYATSNRGADHLSGRSIDQQNSRAALDCLGGCFFSAGTAGPGEFMTNAHYASLYSAITGRECSAEDFVRIGERAFNLEKMFNLREGFTRADDWLPERFFTEPLTVGPKKGAVLKRDEFTGVLDQFYKTRGWDQATTKPSDEKLIALGLGFTIGKS
ncbi:aldehyde ferredoxin oxidoreductase family protein [Fundidesulfovibrio soli]|uniref:aldehyde ferredoxin oxidoreductase family protein n=1 Tax=Fundidesulfovibrio soli TaxID=2922716 RepID=UPI001FB0272B|nr:aldehyde ferredoxin oxidoreductase family protein [Fundidesulfovibrio soli]